MFTCLNIHVMPLILQLKLFMSRLLYIFLVLTLGYQSQAQQKLKPVADSSKVQFTIKNFGINSNGQLSGLKGEILFDQKKLAASNFDITVDASSINTQNTKRDNHLRAPDFFDAAKYPQIRITGKPFAAGPNAYVLKGNLTIKNVTRPVEIPFTVARQGKGLLFSGSFRINRLDYTIGGNSATMADELSIDLKVLAQ